MTDNRFLVPISDSITLRQTVAYAVRNTVESTGESAIHFVYPIAERGEPDEASDSNPMELLDRVAIWAREDLGDRTDIEIETAVVGTEEYLFSPSDYVNVLCAYASEQNLDTAILDPEFDPSGATLLLPSLRTELDAAGLTVEDAPVERSARRSGLVRGTGLAQYLLLSGLSFGFYLLVAGSLAVFDLVTGAISALIVATLLWRVTLTGPVSPLRLTKQFARMLVYTPYLLWEIAKANVEIAYVVLHPRLPIDPEMVEFDAAVWSELPVTTLANSITLTPGTLTVDVTSQNFTVHTLTGSAREALFDGALERAVRFVYYGRAAARIPSPSERGENDGGSES